MVQVREHLGKPNSKLSEELAHLERALAPETITHTAARLGGLTLATTLASITKHSASRGPASASASTDAASPGDFGAALQMSDMALEDMIAKLTAAEASPELADGKALEPSRFAVGAGSRPRRKGCPVT